MEMVEVMASYNDPNTVFHKLEAIGFRVGQKLVERYVIITKPVLVKRRVGQEEVRANKGTFLHTPMTLF